jgi:hypothetical protein
MARFRRDGNCDAVDVGATGAGGTLITGTLLFKAGV